MDLRSTPVHPLFGIRFEALDVASLDEATFEAVRQLIHEHGFALFPGQSLPPARVVSFARRFGEPLPGYRPQFTHPRYPQLVRLGNVTLEDGGEAYLNTQGIEWHSDGTGAVLPPNVTLLHHPAFGNRLRLRRRAPPDVPDHRRPAFVCGAGGRARHACTSDPMPRCWRSGSPTA